VASLRFVAAGGNGSTNREAKRVLNERMFYATIRPELAELTRRSPRLVMVSAC
jgi:hypothetical protein